MFDNDFTIPVQVGVRDDALVNRQGLDPVLSSKYYMRLGCGSAKPLQVL